MNKQGGLMSKCVLLSIRPQYCEMICNGKKTIEVRKTRPKLKTPFKCYIYCTIGGDALCPPHVNSPKWDIHRRGDGTPNGRKMTARERNESDYCFANGKVIGEFVCDKMYGIYYSIYPHDPPVFEEIGTLNRPNVMGETCLSEIELNDYLDGETGYGWHISALQIYDKPRELNEFYRYCTEKDDCHKCIHWDSSYDNTYYEPPDPPFEGCGTGEKKYFTRPPQSWCYVEDYDGKR